MTPRIKTDLIDLDFTSDIKRLTDDFIGREWLYRKVDFWLEETHKRFFILTGEPGVGKSAFAASLTKTREDIAAYNFCISGRNDTIVPNTVLRSLGAQLGHNLPGYGEALANTIKPEKLSIDVKINVKEMTGGEITGVIINHLHASDPKELMEIILRAPFVDLPKPANPCIILIDSMDEAVTYGNDVNIVTLLAGLNDLPSWVRIFCTSRPDRSVLSYFNNLSPHILAAESKMNFDDIELYLSNRMAKKSMKDRIKTTGKNYEELITALSDKDLHKGNFLYVKILLDDIEAGRQSLDDLNALPKSIDEIYHGFLLRLKPKWEDLYQPIFNVLAVAIKPISEIHLANFTSIKRTMIHQSLGKIIQFLNEFGNAETVKTYEIYHTSFREYLMDEKRNMDFWCYSVDANKLIINYYWSNNRNNWNDLHIDDYGLDNLATHLAALLYKEHLHKLIDKEWIEVRYEKSGNSYNGPLKDLDIAWQVAANSNQPDIKEMIRLKVVSSIIMERVRDEDIKTMNWLDQGSKQLGLVRAIDQPYHKFKDLLAVFKNLRNNGNENLRIILEAYEIAKSMPLGMDKFWVLLEIIKSFEDLSHKRFDEALGYIEITALQLSKDNSSIDSLLQIFDVLITSNRSKAIQLMEKTFEIIHEIKDSCIRSRALCQFAQTQVQYDIKGAKHTLDESLELIESFIEEGKYDSLGDSETGRAAVLRDTAVLLSWFNDPRADRVFEECENEFKKSVYPRRHDSWYESLINALIDAGKLEQALNKIKCIQDHGYRLETLCRIRKKLLDIDSDKANAILEDVIKQVDTVNDIIAKSRVLNYLVEAFLNLENIDKAIYFVKKFEKEPWLESSYFDVIEFLAKIGRYAEAQLLLPNIKKSYIRGKLEIILAENLIKSEKIDVAESIAIETSYGEARHTIFKLLANHLAHRGDKRANQYFEQAKSTEDELYSDFGSFKGALDQIVKILINIQEYDRAYSITTQISDAQTKAGLLIELGAVHTKKYMKHALKLFNEAHETIQKIEDEWYKEEILTELGETYGIHGFNDKAEEIAYLVRFTDSYWKILTTTMISLIESDDTNISEFFTFCEQQLTDNVQVGFAAESILKVATKLLQNNDYKADIVLNFSEQYVFKIPDPIIQVKSLCKLARGILCFYPQLAETILSNAEELIEKIDDEIEVKRLLSDIDSINSELDHFHEIISIITTISDMSKFDNCKNFLSSINDLSDPVLQLQNCIELLNYNHEIDIIEKILKYDLSQYAREKLLIAYGTILSQNNDNYAEDIFYKLEKMLYYTGRTDVKPTLEYFSEILIKSGQIGRGLLMIRAVDGDHMIYKIGCCIPILKNYSIDFAKEILHTVTSVAGWYRPDWQRINQIIAEDLPPKE